MATIINTLEIIVEPPKSPPPGQTAAPRVTPAPNDIRDVIEREQHQSVRLRAH